MRKLASALVFVVGVFILWGISPAVAVGCVLVAASIVALIAD